MSSHNSDGQLIMLIRELSKEQIDYSKRLVDREEKDQ